MSKINDIENKLLQYKDELLKASLDIKTVPEIPSSAKMSNSKERSEKMKHIKGKLTEQFNYEGEKKLDKEVNRVAKEEGPDMASPENPKGLKNKRKPVTHDECGRPFAKSRRVLLPSRFNQKKIQKPQQQGDALDAASMYAVRSSPTPRKSKARESMLDDLRQQTSSELDRQRNIVANPQQKDDSFSAESQIASRKGREQEASQMKVESDEFVANRKKVADALLNAKMITPAKHKQISSMDQETLKTFLAARKEKKDAMSEQDKHGKKVKASQSKLKSLVDDHSAIKAMFMEHMNRAHAASGDERVAMLRSLQPISDKMKEAHSKIQRHQDRHDELMEYGKKKGW
jgi:hypothetical protein